MAGLDARPVTRVLVTGASGFVGRQVVAALLARGCEVHTAGRQSGGPPGATHHRADLLVADAASALLTASRPDTVVHCAWFVEHGRFWNAPENLDWIAATLRLARAAASSGVGRFVGAGTCMEYDWSHEPGRARREDDPLAAASLYAEAKLATFRTVGRFLDGEGVAFAWARIFHPFGTGEPRQKLIPSVVRDLLRGEAPIVRSGRLVRDFVAVEDAGAAIAALAVSPVTGAVNIATGEAVTVREVVEAVRAALGGNTPIRFEDDPLGREPATMTAAVNKLRHEVGHPAPPALAGRLAAYARAIAQKRQPGP